MIEGNNAFADHCPHCRHALEIIAVKFKLTGAAIISACANCGMAVAEKSNSRALQDRWGALVARLRIAAYRWTLLKARQRAPSRATFHRGHGPAERRWNKPQHGQR
jgi:hypothetical protein